MTEGIRSRIQRIENVGIYLDREHGDTWGASMGALFGICDALRVAGEDIPASWQYRPGMGASDELSPDEDYEAIVITEAVDAGALTWDDVRRAGDVLNRYTHILERAGRSY